jgi:hypothetical protein
MNLKSHPSFGQLKQQVSFVSLENHRLPRRRNSLTLQDTENFDKTASMLDDVLVSAALGIFPPVDGRVEVIAPPFGYPFEYVLEFTGHAYLMTTLLHEEVLAMGADGFGGAVHPDTLRALAGPEGWIDCHDVLLVRPGTGVGMALAEQFHLENHYRVKHGRSLRPDLRVFGDERGFVGIGHGIANRWEISVEVEPQLRSSGNARALLNEAIGSIPANEWCFAQISPGNSASLRAFLAADWSPIGAEVIYQPNRAQTVTNS